jgi:hypothetical protein
MIVLDRMWMTMLMYCASGLKLYLDPQMSVVAEGRSAFEIADLMNESHDLARTGSAARRCAWFGRRIRIAGGAAAG